MDVLLRIKRLVIARRVEFTMKATEERLRDGLAVEDVLESIVNANAIKKVLRSRSARRVGAGERLYVIVRYREPYVHGNVGLLEGNGPPQRRTGGLLCLRLSEARPLGRHARRAHARSAERRASCG